MEILKMSNNETLYCFSANEYKQLRMLFTTLQGKFYGMCYRHERFTKNECNAIISHLGRLLNE